MNHKAALKTAQGETRQEIFVWARAQAQLKT